MAFRLFALASTAVTFGGRYHELNPLVDRVLAFAFDYGFLRDRRQDAPAGEGPARSAVEHWAAAGRAAPDLPICHYRHASALRKAGAFEPAREAVAQALARFPDNLGTVVEAARLAERCGDFAGAHLHWQKLVAAGRPRAMWLAGAGQALVNLGRVDEAEALIAEGRAAHPRHAGLLAAECALAARKREWSRAVALSREFQRRFPDHAGSHNVLGQSIYADALSKIDQAVREPPVMPTRRAKASTVKSEEIRQLLLRFESIGDNCEFGLLQRQFGAEPLGLLRWNRVDAEELIAALDHRLEGIGQPEHTELILTESREFFVMDRRFYLGMHTFLFADQATHEELYPAMLRRTAALKDRFVKDLAAGDKTFVFSSGGLDRKTLLELHRALGTFGPVRLLAVQPAKPATPAGFAGAPGDIEVVGPGCYVGFLTRRGLVAGETWDIAVDDWIAICRKVEALGAAEPSAAPHARIA